MKRKRPIDQVFEHLKAHYGPQHWWPAETPFEVIVGAVLTQNTSWKNVERALENLRQAELLSPRELYQVPLEELAELLRPAGYYRLKARRLRNLLEMIVEQYDADLTVMFSQPIDVLRERLLAVNGIGPETADSILLYAGGLPRFVVDAYTHRLVTRHGWIEPEADYHTLQAWFEERLEADPPLYNEYHALIVRVGNQHCRKTPRCQGCPLEKLLPPGGPQWVDL